MSQKILIVIDMQNDFVGGVLGNEETRAVADRVVDAVNHFDGDILFTKDTHSVDYLRTQEGKYLPVEHCIEGTEGWELIEPLKRMQREKHAAVYTKGTFGCISLAKALCERNERERIEEIILIGVCTDICVVSNALLIKAHLPEVMVSCRADCCAGVTPEKHAAALETMRSCQVNVI